MELTLKLYLNKVHTRNKQVIGELKMLNCVSKEVRKHVDEYLSTCPKTLPGFLMSNMEVMTDWFVLKVVCHLRQMTLTENCGPVLEKFLNSHAFGCFRANLVNRADGAARIMPLCAKAGLVIEFPSNSHLCQKWPRDRVPVNEKSWSEKKRHQTSVED